MIERSQVHEGMTVRSSDGVTLGRVLTCDETSFVVEEEIFGGDYVVPYADVMEASGDEIRLAVPRERLMDSPPSRDEGDEDGEGGARLGMRRDPGVQPLSYGDEGGGGLL